MTYAGYVLRHLRARPLRATLTAGAFAFSIGLLGFLMLLSSALRKEWSPHMAQRMIVTAKSSFFDKLPMAYLAKIEATPGVDTVVPFDFVVGFHRDARPENQVPIQAAPAEPMLRVYMEANVPPEQAKAWIADPTGALVGPLLAEKLGWKVGDRIVAVNGHSIDANYTRGELWQVRSRPAGTLVKLTMASGDVRELRLADYS